MTEQQIIIKFRPPNQLAIACSFESAEVAIKALEEAKRKIAAGQVAMQGGKPGGIEVVNELPPDLRWKG